MDPAELASQRRRIVISGAIGTAVEFYDFFVYGFLAPFVLDRLFFPKLDPTVGTIAILATYALGYGARPLGGILFGHWADKYGRRPVMFATLSLMGVASTLIGCLPTYAAIGVWAPILLTVLRLLQGIALGGESTGGPIFALESAPGQRRGLFAGLVQVGGALGSLMAAAAGALVGLLSTADLEAWGWRLPFLISIFLVGLGIYVRARIMESPAFVKAMEDAPPEKVPLVALFQRAKKPLAIVFFCGLGESAMVNFFAVFGLFYALQAFHLPRSMLLTGVLIGNFFSMFANPLLGRLSDAIGRRVILGAGYILGPLFAAFCFIPWLATKNPVWVIVAMAIPPTILQPAIFAIEGSFYGELFDETRLRFSGAALGRQLGNAIGGGTLPVIAAWILASNGGHISGPLWYYAAISLVSLIAVLVAHETNKKRI
ncbi:MAG TPA: MFS transporter [Hyphomicrobiales bacterium]|nr:MFS transporter [Hyphomicrobiales bacterium]